MASTLSRSQVLGKRSDSGQLGTVNSYHGTAPYFSMSGASSSDLASNASLERMANDVGKSNNGMAIGGTGNSVAGVHADKHNAVISPMTLVTPARTDRMQGSAFTKKTTISPNAAEGAVCLSIARSLDTREINTLTAIRTAFQIHGKTQVDGVKERLREMPAEGDTEAARWSTPTRVQVATMSNLTLPLPYHHGSPAAGLFGWPVVAGRLNLKMTKPNLETMDTYGGGEPVKVSNEWISGSGKTVARLDSTTLAIWFGRVDALSNLDEPLTTANVKPLTARPIAYDIVPLPGSRCSNGVASSPRESPYAISQIVAFAYVHPGTKKVIAGALLEDNTIVRLGHVVATDGATNLTTNAQFYAEKEKLPLADRLAGKDVLGSARSVSVAINPLYT